MKTELINLKLADWSRTVGMAMIERRATVQELIESAVSHVGDDLLRIAVAHAEQKNGLTYGKNKRAGDDRAHMEWHAKCGCAYHPEPFPHVHPCSDAHKRPDLHSGSREADIRQLHEKFDKLAAKDPMNNEASSKWRAFASELIAILERPAGSREAAPEDAGLVDVEAVSWAYRKLLAFGVGSIKAEDAHMLDRLNLMLQEPPK